MNWKKLFPIIGITLFIYILFSVGLDRTISAFLTADLFFLLFVLLLVIPTMLIQTFKWDFLLKNQGIKLPFWYLFKVYWIGLFYGAITPGKVGSLIRISYIKEKTGKNFGEASQSVILDRLMDFFPLFLLALIGVILLADYFIDLVYLFIVSAFILVFIFWFFLDKERSKMTLGFLHAKVIPEKLKGKSRESFHAFYRNLPSKRKLLVSFLLSFLAWIFLLFQSWLISQAYGFNVPFFTFIFILPIAGVIAMIPITVNGLGTREATLIFIFAVFGVSAETVIAFSILNFLYTEGIGLFGWFISLGGGGIKKAI
ncbi:MAG: lysylphosphatidylglycerol synthase transmembrane domain-containing protein [Candidatus Diapherotrites archaeon]